MFLIDLPIEPIEDRYSIQWTEWFSEAWKRNDITALTIKGSSHKSDCFTVKPGEFLNPRMTFMWKFGQLKFALQYLEQIKTGETVVAFLHDAWFPGIESLKYFAEMKEIDLKIVGFWHAGSYLSNDLLGIKGFHSWVRGSELTWFHLCDAVCVGSEYHKNRILASLGQCDTDADKVHVTGYPIEVPNELLATVKKEKIIVWPHRIAEDKHPEIFEKLAHEACFDGWRFIRSKDVCKTKYEYYELLAKSKIAVSTATMETFGIAMVEAACMACRCIVPRSLCYPEIFNCGELYNDYKDLKDILKEIIETLESEDEHEFETEAIKTEASDMRNFFSQVSITNDICEIIKEVGNA